MVPNARFKELLADIEPSSTTKSNASNAHTGVRRHLRLHPTFSKRWEDDFLAGSYARDTAIRPRKTEDGYDRPDVDIIAVTKFSITDHPDDVLEELAKALGDEYKVERINKRSVRVITPNAEIDVVPVIETATAFMLPDRDLGYWKATNPPAHTSWSANQNTRFEGNFKPLVKLFKWCKRHSYTVKRPKGFVLEVLVAKHAPVGESHCGEAFAKMLESIYKEYGALADAGLKPTIYDPGLAGNDILSKVSITDWKAFIEKVRVHAGYARRAQSTEDTEIATELWRRIFGPRFRETLTVAKASSVTSYATAPVAVDNYTFPNKPINAVKPRGFA